jgi:hypothetical protein
MFLSLYNITDSVSNSCFESIGSNPIKGYL